MVVRKKWGEGEGFRGLVCMDYSCGDIDDGNACKDANIPEVVGQSCVGNGGMLQSTDSNEIF